MARTMTSRAAELTQLGDADLVEEIYELVQTLESDALSIEFYFLLAEAFERFAPNVELELVRRKNVDGDEGLRQSIERMGRAHVTRLTARAVRQRQREGDDA